MYNHVSPKTILVAPCESKPWPVSPARSPGQPYCLHILLAPPTGPTCSSKSGSPAVGASVLPVLPTWMPVCQRGRRSANVDAFLASIQDFGGGRKNDNRATVCQPVYQPHPMPGFLITKTPRDVSESEPTPGSVSFEALGQSHGRKFLWAWRLNAKARTL